MTVPQAFVVIEDWVASYDNPITVTTGEQVWLNGREDVWDGNLWLWACSKVGLEGWVPDNLIRSINDAMFAKYDYSARELDCKAGDTLQAAFATHGWSWCTTQDRRSGWVPDRCLRKCIQ